MSGVKRKLSGVRGATLVFAMAVFLILEIFCASLVSASLNAAESSARLRQVEKISASVNSAARLIQDSLTGASIDGGPEMVFRTESQRWARLYDSPRAGDAEAVLTAALNNDGPSPVEFILRVRSDDAETAAAFEDVRLSVTAKNRTGAALEQYLADEDPAYLPTLVLRFVHPADGPPFDYAMTMRIAARAVEPQRNSDGDATGYFVTFDDGDGLRVRSTPGLSS